MVSVWPSTGGTTSIGLEVMQAQALLQIVQHLPAELDRQAQAWDPVDVAMARNLQVTYYRTILERPPRSSYYSGARLGVLKMPVDSFPAVMVMADAGTPTPESARFDGSMAAYSISLYIECVVRSDEFWDRPDNPEDIAGRVFEEGVVDRRAKRTLEALVQCIDLDRALGGVCPGLSDPSVSQTDAFALPSMVAGSEQKSRIFSLVRAEYAADNYPSHRDSSTPPPDSLLRGFGPT